MCMERLIQPSLILHMHHQLHTLVDIPRKPPRASSYGPKEREARQQWCYSFTATTTPAKHLCAISGWESWRSGTTLRTREKSSSILSKLEQPSLETGDP